MRGAVAAGAVYGLGTVGPFVREAIAQEGGGDVEILNFALTLEYLEAAFYNQALRRVGDLSGDVKSLATEIRDNEVEHVDAPWPRRSRASAECPSRRRESTSATRSRARSRSSSSPRRSRTLA